MKLSQTLTAVALSFAVTTPALAGTAIADVPSLWPADGAFETPEPRTRTLMTTKTVSEVPQSTVQEIQER